MFQRHNLILSSFCASSMRFLSEWATIFGCATPPVKCAVSVIRISGPNALKAVSSMTSIDLNKVRSRYAYVTSLRHAIHPGSILDEVLLLVFKAPKSYTGEHVVEFHCHGGIAVTDAILNSLSSIPTFRFAEPGEFTKRAVLNGKLSLRQAEGINNIVNAQTEKQRSLALSQMTQSKTNLKRGTERFQTWRDQLIHCHAKIEAVLNFADEDGVDAESQMELIKVEVGKISQEMKERLRKLNRSKSISTGISVAIVGRPNVGKSSLLNILCDKHAALVSPLEGTTRDAIEVLVDFHGWPLTFVDTAGIRETNDVIEKMGVEMSAKVIERADIIIEVHSFDSYASNFEESQNVDFNSEPCGTRKVRQPCGTPRIKVMNKIDLYDVGNSDQKLLNFTHDFQCVSCLTMQGVDVLLEKLKCILDHNFSDLEENFSFMGSQLERTMMEKCVIQLDHLLSEDDEVMVAEYFKTVLNEMSTAAGFAFTDDVLDSVFKNFCIGK